MGRRPSPEAMEVYRDALLDEDLRRMREQFCRAASASLGSIANWLGFDSWLGAGDLGRPSSEASPADPNHSRFVAFRASAVVIEMASELTVVAITALDGGLRYGAAAVIRQLIETEYLLAAFTAEFESAERWALSSPEDIRRSFSPKTMRQVGGFSNEEYWRHCDAGGHPSPTGRFLLRFGDPLVDEDLLTSSVWGDLAQHLRRLWHRVDTLLAAEHARYESVRSSDRRRVAEAEAPWIERDPLATPTDFGLP